MAFYLRKAFKAGPIRLNLSKGGLGISAGVTGARIGLNSRGAYVHGGRHGMYYRKHLNTRKSSARSQSTTSNRTSKHNLGTVSLFTDTGVTLANVASRIHSSVRTEPVLPSGNLVNTPIQVAFIASLLLFIMSVVEGILLIYIPSLIVAVLCLGWIGMNYLWKRKAANLLDETISETERIKTLPRKNLSGDLKLPERWVTWLGLHLHAIITEMTIGDDKIDTVSTLWEMDDLFPNHKTIVERIRAFILGNLLDEWLEDYILSENEEQAFRNLAKQLGLDDSVIGDELQRLDYFSHIRRETERPLETVDPGMPMVRGEEAYEIFEPARLLNERVLNRFQRDNVQYRELGYEIGLEGKLVLTDRRLLLAGRGTREYRLNRLVNITVDAEAGIVELSLTNRNSPVLITVKNPVVLAGRIEKVIEKQGF